MHWPLGLTPGRTLFVLFARASDSSTMALPQDQIGNLPPNAFECFTKDYKEMLAASPIPPDKAAGITPCHHGNKDWRMCSVCKEAK